jgi:1,4-dihydroxy-2-naphthoyl-CoA hydrolase
MDEKTRDQLKNSNTLASHLGIEFLDVTKDKLVARMPVDERTKQPYGLLHGGASGVLVETLASIGAMLNVDATKDSAVGVELHCRHLSSARDGWVVGTATPDKLGKNIHFWKVQIVKEEDPSKIICEGSCTVFVRVG